MHVCWQCSLQKLYCISILQFTSPSSRLSLINKCNLHPNPFLRAVGSSFCVLYYLYSQKVENQAISWQTPSALANSQCSGILELGDLIHTPINHHMVRCLLLISDVASLQFTSWVQRFTSPCTDTLFKQNIIYPLIWLVHIISIQPSVYIDVQPIQFYIKFNSALLLACSLLLVLSIVKHTYPTLLILFICSMQPCYFIWI